MGQQMWMGQHMGQQMRMWMAQKKVFVDVDGATDVDGTTHGATDERMWMAQTKGCGCGWGNR